ECCSRAGGGVSSEADEQHGPRTAGIEEGRALRGAALGCPPDAALGPGECGPAERSHGAPARLSHAHHQAGRRAFAGRRRTEIVAADHAAPRGAGRANAVPKNSKARVSIAAPRVSIEAPRVSIEAPRVSIEAPRVSIEA